MAKILITPEEVDQVSSQFKQSAEQSQQLVDHLKSAVEGMQGQWEGMTQQRFFQEFQEAQTQMRSFVDLLNNVSTELSQIAERFRQVDQQ